MGNIIWVPQCKKKSHNFSAVNSFKSTFDIDVRTVNAAAYHIVAKNQRHKWDAAQNIDVGKLWFGSFESFGVLLILLPIPTDWTHHFCYFCYLNFPGSSIMEKVASFYRSFFSFRLFHTQTHQHKKVYSLVFTWNFWDTTHPHPCSEMRSFRHGIVIADNLIAPMIRNAKLFVFDDKLKCQMKQKLFFYPRQHYLFIWFVPKNFQIIEFHLIIRQMSHSARACPFAVRAIFYVNFWFSSLDISYIAALYFIIYLCAAIW